MAKQDSTLKDLSNEEKLLKELFGELKIVSSEMNQGDAAKHISDIQTVLNRIFLTLTYREREVIKMRYGIDGNESQTFEAIGKFFLVTRERVKQVLRRALEKLQHPSRACHLVKLVGLPEIQLSPYDEVKEGKSVVHRSVEDLDLNSRCKRGLTVLRVKTIGQLTEYSAEELLGQKSAHLGMASVSLIQVHVHRCNLKLKGETDLSDLDLSTRARNGLKFHGIKTIQKLTECTEKDLLREKGVLGRTSLNEIKHALAQLGLSLKEG